MTDGKLYLHIGPPKTATTSLQVALQETDLAALHYGGTFQPRAANAGSLAQTLYKAAATLYRIRLRPGGARQQRLPDSAADHFAAHLTDARTRLLPMEPTR